MLGLADRAPTQHPPTHTLSSTARRPTCQLHKSALHHPFHGLCNDSGALFSKSSSQRSHTSRSAAVGWMAQRTLVQQQAGYRRRTTGRRHMHTQACALLQTHITASSHIATHTHIISRHRRRRRVDISSGKREDGGLRRGARTERSLTTAVRPAIAETVLKETHIPHPPAHAAAAPVRAVCGRLRRGAVARHLRLPHTRLHQKSSS